MALISRARKTDSGNTGASAGCRCGVALSSIPPCVSASAATPAVDIDVTHDRLGIVIAQEFSLTRAKSLFVFQTRGAASWLHIVGQCERAAYRNAAVATMPRAVRTAWSEPHFRTNSLVFGPAAPIPVAISALFVGMMPSTSKASSRSSRRRRSESPSLASATKRQAQARSRRWQAALASRSPAYMTVPIHKASIGH
jgi:hypothetical protein